MIVYIESNFILEIVRRQKHAVPAEAILQLAEDGKIELVFPSFALSEPFATVSNREWNQIRLSRSLEGMVEQLPILLADAAKREKERLWDIVNRLIEVGTSIEIDKICFKTAKDYQDRLALSMQDSIIYSAVILDLQCRVHDEPKCFMNSNYKDFKTPAIIDELNSYNCYFEQSFAKGLNFVQHCIKYSS